MAIVTLTLALMAGACGEASSSGTGSAGPEEPVSNTPGDGPAPSPSATIIDGARLVEPRPGMADTRPIPWQRAEPVEGGRILRVFFTSGVEPCYVLDRVEVEESAEKVVVTLFEGNDASAGDVACIEIAENKVVEIELAEPIGDRPVKDGAKS